MKTLKPWAAAALLAGCIENPGPDKRLNEDYNSANFSVWHQGAEFLEIGVDRDSGRYEIYVTPQDGPTSDSAEFFAYGRHFPGEFPLVRERPADDEFQFHGLARYPYSGLDPIGEVEDLMPGNMEDRFWEARLIRAWRNGLMLGHSLGGMYQGTWEQRKPDGKARTGTVVGLVDARGDWDFTFTSTDGKADEAYLISWWRGGTSGDSALYPTNGSPRPYNHPRSAIQARYRAEGDSLFATWPLSPIPPTDSVSIRCVRLASPR